MIPGGNLRPGRLDLGASSTESARDRENLVTVGNMARPGDAAPDWEHPEIDGVVRAVVRAHRNGRPVIWSMGAHVIKCGLSLYVIDLIHRGVITHVAGNGAVSIHDFELAYLGGTSEYVPHAIEDGSFGMWEETGRWMNEAVREGHAKGLGYGASLARSMDVHPERFPHRDSCIVYRAYRRGVPATYHLTLGADIIHQPPAADFRALGGTSGVDFAIYARSISRLEGGVFLNFGSAVTGPEVFLKALSIARNQGYGVEEITTANFDLLPLGDYRSEVDQDHPHYYYRPRKNIVNRPTSLGGRGYHIEGHHRDTVPVLYAGIMENIGGDVTDEAR